MSLPVQLFKSPCAILHIPNVVVMMEASYQPKRKEHVSTHKLVTRAQGSIPYNSQTADITLSIDR